MTTLNSNTLQAQPADLTKKFQPIADAMKEGWNSKSGATFASVFADTHDYIIWTGNFIPGLSKEVNARQHQGIFDSIYKNTQMKNEIAKAKMIRDDLALVHLYAKVWDKGQPEPENWSVLISLLVEKQNEDWLIISFHNSDLEKGAGPNAKEWYTLQKAKIKQHTESMYQAWNERDAVALASHFVDGYDQVVPGQGLFANVSRKACEEMHVQLFQQAYTEPGSETIESMNVQFVKPDVALVHVSTTDPSTNKKALATAMLEMDIYENWLVRSLNFNSLPQTTGEATGQTPNVDK